LDTHVYCSTIYKKPSFESIPDVPRLKNGLRSVYKDTMQFYSAIKNEIILFAGKRVELENITLSEASQAQKNQRLPVFPYRLIS
jgi:hypothetical protein